jgi:hypothetical protein
MMDWNHERRTASSSTPLAVVTLVSVAAGRRNILNPLDLAMASGLQESPPVSQ